MSYDCCDVVAGVFSRWRDVWWEVIDDYLASCLK